MNYIVASRVKTRILKIWKTRRTYPLTRVSADYLIALDNYMRSQIATAVRGELSLPTGLESEDRTEGPSLLVRRRVQDHLLARMNDTHPGFVCKQVEDVLLRALEAKLLSKIVSDIRRHPSRGVTFRP